MTGRLAMMCFMAMLLIGISSPPAWAQTSDPHAETLKGISAVPVLVEDLPDSAKALGLTSETIQTDVELKLRLAGMRVVTQEESLKLPGMPLLYVQVGLTDNAKASCIYIRLTQNVTLQRNGQVAAAVATWDTGSLMVLPNAQGIRNAVKDNVDKFLNAWLSVNPKK